MPKGFKTDVDKRRLAALMPEKAMAAAFRRSGSRLPRDRLLVRQKLTAAVAAAGLENRHWKNWRGNESSPVRVGSPVLVAELFCVLGTPLRSAYPLAKWPTGPKPLRDAANYIKKLPKAEHDTPEWRLAIQMLIDAAEDRGPMLFAKMGILRAVNRNVERVFNPGRKDPHWGKRKLARDR